MSRPVTRPDPCLPRYLLIACSALLLVACGGDGDDDPAPPAPDTTAPTVSVQQPTGTVNRSATLEATASDNVGVTEVEFFVDDESIGTDTSAPYSVEWDTAGVDDGDHSVEAVARDAAGNSATSAGVIVTVQNTLEFSVEVTPEQEVPVPDSGSSGNGTFTVNLATGAVSGSVTAAGFDSTAAHLHDGFAGVNGPVIVGLERDATDVQLWAAPADASLTQEQVDGLLAGRIYVNVHSEQFPGGEVRAQLLPPGFELHFVDLAGIQEVPAVLTSASGRGAVTVDTSDGSTVIHVNTLGPDGALAVLPGVTAAHLHRGLAGINGPVVIGLDQDPDNDHHWFNDDGSLSGDDLDALGSAGTYLNVHSDDHAGGEIRGQVVPQGFAVVFSRLDGEQEVPEPNITLAVGTAAVTVNESTGATEVVANVQGADEAQMAHVHDGFAGVNGPVIIGLEQDAGEPGVWRSNGATLTEPQRTLLAQGGLYVNVHTEEEPAGLIRGQLLPEGVELVITYLNGAQEAPDPVDTTADGRAFTTVDTAGRRLTTHVHTTGVDDATMAHIHTEARNVAGPVTIGLELEPGSTSHWLASDVALTEEQFTAYREGLFYVNVHTPANPPGEIRGQIELGGTRPLLYAQIQNTIFNATCASSGCHAGDSPAQGLDLSSSVSHEQLVGVPSEQVAELSRVAPGDAPASYLVRKLRGGPDIVGVRMPPGADPLDPATIDALAAWVNAGALPSPVAVEPPMDTVAPTVTLGAVPDPASGVVTLTATASDDTGVTTVRWRVNGSVVGSDATAPYSFDWNSASVANGAVTIDAQALDAAGNVGTSAMTSVTVSNEEEPGPYTFSQIQTEIFTPTCALSGCHTGGNPAGELNLSAGTAYGELVNVFSSGRPALYRVFPGGAAQSYLIHKLEGGPNILGARMPFGGPFLDQETINRIRAWINDGAPNN